jgi:two-component system, cell cycle response regulator DivK
MSTILIVEDNERSLKLVRDVLQYRGHSTLEATNGADGVRLAREHRPDLILMDIQLPDLDGISALRQLRSDPAVAGTPIFAISASAMPDEQQAIVASGFDAYITKPLNLSQFIEAVERRLPRREPGT